MTWEERAIILWGLLDDIDTAADMAKSNDASFRKWVYTLMYQRFNLAESDGHKLFWKEKPEPVRRLNLDTGQVQ